MAAVDEVDAHDEKFHRHPLWDLLAADDQRQCESQAAHWPGIKQSIIEFYSVAQNGILWNLNLTSVKLYRKLRI